MNQQDRDQLKSLEDSFTDSLGSLEDRIGKGMDRIGDQLEAINGRGRTNSERIAKIEGARDSERGTGRFTPRNAAAGGAGVVGAVWALIEVAGHYLGGS